MLSLNKKFLDKFKEYLDNEGIPHRAGKGEYQALQVYYGGAWGILYLSKTTPDHANAKTDAMSDLVESFLKSNKE